MSGGHWDYNEYRLKEDIASIGKDETVRQRFPSLALFFRKLALIVENVVHDLDYDICGDSSIKDDKKFEKEALGKFKKALGIIEFTKETLEKIRSIEKEVEDLVFKEPED